MAACADFASKAAHAGSGAPCFTVSVRMGISRGSGVSGCMAGSFLGRLPKLMRLERHVAVAVRLEALAAEASALLIGVDDFGDTRVALPVLGQPSGQVYQQVGRRRAHGQRGEVYLGGGIGRLLVHADLVRNERAFVECPEQIIER